MVKHYIPLIQNEFDIVAANKTANILHIDFYGTETVYEIYIQSRVK